MSTSPVGMNSANPVNPAASSSASSKTSSTTASQQNAIDALSSPDTFLQLLVAQLKYQDPQSPADGTAFVTQLATFSGVEEQSAMRSDLDSIDTVAQKWSGGPAALTAPAATTSASASTAPATNSATQNTTGTSN